MNHCREGLQGKSSITNKTVLGTFSDPTRCQAEIFKLNLTILKYEKTYVLGWFIMNKWIQIIFKSNRKFYQLWVLWKIFCEFSEKKIFDFLKKTLEIFGKKYLNFMENIWIFQKNIWVFFFWRKYLIVLKNIWVFWRNIWVFWRNMWVFWKYVWVFQKKYLSFV